MALRNAARPSALGWLRLGAAVPERARALRALRHGAWPAAQEAHGLGPPSVAPDRALAARTARGRGGGQQLFRDRTPARREPTPVHDLTAAARCWPLRAGPTAQARHTRAATGQRRSPPELAGAAGRSSHSLALGQHRWLVWPRRTPPPHRLRHGALAAPRHAGADPLGVSARPKRREGAAGFPVHRPRRRPGGHPALVCPALAS